MLNELRPDVLNPPAIVVQAFDEEKVLAECRALIERRDEAKGEFKSAIIALGHKLIEARRAMPGSKGICGKESYSPAFVKFIERCGLARKTVVNYMSYAQNPSKLAIQRVRYGKLGGTGHYRRKALREILDAYENGYSAEEIFAAIRKEINEAK